MDTNLLLDWKHWAKGLLAASISGFANSISVMVVDPINFNFDDGFGKLWKVALFSGLVGAAMYLKQSPLPAGEDTLKPKDKE